MNEANEGNPLVVTLSIPRLAEYVGVARLAILGVASRLNFSYDEVEDLRLAVGEACTGAVEKGPAPDGKDADDICLRCEILPSQLSVTVSYRDAAVAPGSVDSAGSDNIGALLMEILVDKMWVEHDTEKGTIIRLIKSVQAV